MKRIFSWLIVLSLLSSFAGLALADGQDPLTGSPWICSVYDSAVTPATPTDLKDDFFLAVNKDAILNYTIPEGYLFSGTMYDVSIGNDLEMLSLFDPSLTYESGDAQLVLSYYRLLTDWDARNAAGTEPLTRLLDMLDGINTIEDLTNYYFHTPLVDQLSTPFAVSVTQDLLDPDRYVGYIDAPSLIMGDSLEYTAPTELGLKERAAIEKFLKAMLLKIGYSEADAEQTIADAFAFDALLAPSIPTNDEQMLPEFISTILNYYTRDEILSFEGSIPAVEYIEDVYGFPPMEVWLCPVPESFELLQSVYTDENLPLIKANIICKSLFGLSAYIDRESYDLTQAMNTEISGAAPLPYELVAANLTSATFPWQLAHMYCETYLTQSDKDTIYAIIEEILAEYKEMLSSESFISESTKATALAKLDAMSIRCLYPDDWAEYAYKGPAFLSAEEGGTLLDATNSVALANIEEMKELVSKPVDHERWPDGIYPTVMNCFYNPQDNSINILAAFCRGGLYSNDMSREELLGKLGAVIGHEITHAFDSTGAQFDASGAFSDWWTADDYTAFTSMNNRIADYLSGMAFWEGLPMKGQIMTGEACADMGAMRCMLNLAAGEEDFDYDLFFRSYADLWSAKLAPYYVELLAQTDNHPIAYVRVNAVLQQFDEFLDFYGITEGDGMYLAPDARVAIW